MYKFLCATSLLMLITAYAAVGADYEVEFAGYTVYVSDVLSAAVGENDAPSDTTSDNTYTPEDAYNQSIRLSCFSKVNSYPFFGEHVYDIHGQIIVYGKVTRYFAFVNGRISSTSHCPMFGHLLFGPFLAEHDEVRRFRPAFDMFDRRLP